MKLKFRVKLAWLELAFSAAMLSGGVGLQLARSTAKTPVGLALDLAIPILLLSPLCLTAWKRLGKVRTQIAELGPEATPSADPWTAPGGPGVVGVMIVLLAVAAALAPSLLLR